MKANNLRAAAQGLRLLMENVGDLPGAKRLDDLSVIMRDVANGLRTEGVELPVDMAQAVALLSEKHRKAGHKGSPQYRELLSLVRGAMT